MANSGFGSYMLINSVVQTLMGYGRRKEQDLAADASERFQIEMRKAKEEFQDEMEARKIADMRYKMQVARKYRTLEKFESTKLKELSGELKVYFDECLPIKKTAVPLLLDAAQEYHKLEYGLKVPLNVVLLHTLQKRGLDYDEINDELDKYAPQLGNIVYRRWCDKDIARNAALLNLHAIMGNIPTLVISPNFQGGKVHFTIAMWEAQCDRKPLIRPLLSIDCDVNKLKDDKGRRDFQKRIAFVSTIISGCARDSYMLLTQGLPPMLPSLLQSNEQLKQFLLAEENSVVRTFMLNEYQTTSQSLEESKISPNALTSSEVKLLISQTRNAIDTIESIK